MIDTEIKIDSATRSRMEKVISDFAEVTGKTVEDGIKRMAKSACKELLNKTQPFGIKTTANMKKFHANLEKQIGTAYIGVNLGVFPATRSMAEAHLAARNPSTGKVRARKFMREKKQPWLFLISDSDREAHVKKIQKKAFRAKAGWLEANNSLGKPKMAKVSYFVTRHLGKGLGGSNVSGEGLSTRVEIHNAVPYLKSVLSTEDIQYATQTGMRNGLKYMQTTTQKAIEKANRELQ